MEEEAPDRGSTGDDRDTGKELVEIEAANVLLGEFGVDNISKTREASDQVVHLDDPLHLGSPERSMLMQALVRTPDQHETMVTSNPFLKPSNRTCLQVAGLQELANAPGIYFSQNIETVSKLLLLSL